MTASAPLPASDTPGTLEESQVRAMFDRISGLYDVMNTVMTAGLHHAWRRRAADLAALTPGDRALDVATGTGDLALELSARVAPGGEVVASDFSEPMLELARAKATARHGDDGVSGAHVRLRFESANALSLPYGDDEFDAATVGFGARNFSDLDRGLREMARVVRPGGRVVVLEMTTPQRPPLSIFFRLWFDNAVPVLGRLAGDPEAYDYLPSSVRRFPGPVELAAVMNRSGLRDIRYILTAGGIIALHVGVVAAEPPPASPSELALGAPLPGESPPGAPSPGESPLGPAA
jgi:demethylmenaquinone methyltransferase / 2-methoxy-6-polyprenyl-1,4-benzoquinol methylase